MAKKPSLIIVPGMGEHDEKSFKKEIVDALNYALGLYADWEGKDIESFVDIVPFEYNSFFTKYRAKVSTGSQGVGKLLETLTADKLAPIVGEFSKWNEELNKDNFFKTHWLDVLLYRFCMLREPIRLKLADALIKAVKAKGSQKVHILGHSLGTSVVHDTLAKLYADPPDPERNLSPVTHRLASVHMVANVSRLLERFVEVAKSVVHPCKGGCTFAYFQYRHIVDPITIPSPFEPMANDVWVDPAKLSESQYQRLRPRLVTDLNTHAVGHYLQNPECHVPLLETLGFGFSANKTEFKKAFEAHEQKALQGKAEDLQKRWEDLNVTQWSSVEAFIRAAQALRDMLAGFGKNFD
jgi:hypothetical protein